MLVMSRAIEYSNGVKSTLQACVVPPNCRSSGLYILDWRLLEAVTSVDLVCAWDRLPANALATFIEAVMIEEEGDKLSQSRALTMCMCTITIGLVQAAAHCTYHICEVITEESVALVDQNRVLVTKPHNKTPHEFLIGRTPIICFMRPFGYPVTILNTLDHLGKFNGKADEGFLVGYSINSKAFRVFNSRTRKVEENLHVNFLENKPNVVGIGPTWLFDIDSLTNSMNYQPRKTEH
ncbi:retrovirus-related pol polyprotein from transposon TNT 1-94 [Tanacetum coccineum]